MSNSIASPSIQARHIYIYGSRIGIITTIFGLGALSLRIFFFQGKKMRCTPIVERVTPRTVHK